MNWVVEEMEGKMLAPVAPEEVEWVELDEPWSYVGKKNGLLAVVSLLIVLSRKSAEGHWAIVEPKRPSVWIRNFLMPILSPSAPIAGIPTASSSSNTAISKARRTPSL
jgi:hypothetical protein